jgi:hypothetical protein
MAAPHKFAAHRLQGYGAERRLPSLAGDQIGSTPIWGTRRAAHNHGEEVSLLVLPAAARRDCT